jgi:hypothetical protein
MSNQSAIPIYHSGDCFSADLIIRGGEFKAYVNKLIAHTSLSSRFRPRLYQYADYIFVKLYSFCEDISTYRASTRLNDLAWARKKRETQVDPYLYRDQTRYRRCFPHQTDVDKFFRLLTESEVKTIFGGILDYLIRKIVFSTYERRSWTAIVDNTKYPYYGKPNPQKHIGTHNLPGTKVAWYFQGISLQSEQMHLFVDFHSLTKGVYRALNVAASVAWELWQGMSITSMLFDREFYRASLVTDLNRIKIPSLFPTKKFQWVKHHMEAYLKGTGDFIVGNLFSQTMKQYPFQQTAFVRLVIIGTNNESAWEIRDQFRQGFLTYREAMKKLRGFFTNMRPWKNRKAWARYLVRTYKRRWNVETGFAELNKVHMTGRERNYTAKLAGLYLRAFVYDGWQAWRLKQIREEVLPRDYTLTEYKAILKEELESNII